MTVLTLNHIFLCQLSPFPSPLLPMFVLSPVLQLGRTAELRGTQELREPISPRWQTPASAGPELFLTPIQETFGKAKEQ